MLTCHVVTPFWHTPSYILAQAPCQNVHPLAIALLVQSIPIISQSTYVGDVDDDDDDDNHEDEERKMRMIMVMSHECNILGFTGCIDFSPVTKATLILYIRTIQVRFGWAAGNQTSMF